MLMTLPVSNYCGIRKIGFTHAAIAEMLAGKCRKDDGAKISHALAMHELEIFLQREVSRLAMADSRYPAHNRAKIRAV